MLSHRSGRLERQQLIAGICEQPARSGTAGENNQISQRKFSCCRFDEAVKIALDFFQKRRTSATAGWLTSLSFCGWAADRAPLAPPSLSDPRKVDAVAQAVVSS
jgi:hypothetical protein